jgi:hypothetical protein
LAQVTIIKRGGRCPPTMTVIFGRIPVEFARAWIDGERCMVATLDDQDPTTADVLQRAATIPKTYRLPTRSPKVIPVDVPKPKPSKPAKRPDLTPREIAVRNGWTASDFEGAGQGDDWGPEGGRGKTSGLTMAEMALSSPPRGWKRDDQWPWEVGSWLAPGQSWQPPELPAKREPEPPAPLAEPVTEEEAKVVDSDYGTEDEIREAVAVLREIVRSGGVPTRQKAAYHLRKHGLPSPNASNFEALLELLKR